jgi:transmembrane sensor
LGEQKFVGQNPLLSQAFVTMLTQLEFEALLDRYLTGTCSPAEQKLVAHWYQQFGPDEPTLLSEAEQQVSRAAIWSLIESQLVEKEKPDSPISALE